MELKLKAVFREKGTKGDLNLQRHNGMVPATFYGQKIDPVSIFVKDEDFRQLMNTDAGSNVLIDLVIDVPDGSTSGSSGIKGKQTAIVKDVQRNPISGDLIHIDLMKISMAEEIQATIPLVIVGEAAGVKSGGVMQHSIREVSVKCLPANLPENIEIDVTELEIGDNVHVSDFKSIEGVEMLSDPEEIVVSIVPPAKVEEVVAEVEEEEAEEGAEEPEVIGEKKETEEEQEKES